MRPRHRCGEWTDSRRPGSRWRSRQPRPPCHARDQHRAIRSGRRVRPHQPVDLRLQAWLTSNDEMHVELGDDVLARDVRRRGPAAELRAFRAGRGDSAHRGDQPRGLGREPHTDGVPLFGRSVEYLLHRSWFQRSALAYGHRFQALISPALTTAYGHPWCWSYSHPLRGRSSKTHRRYVCLTCSRHARPVTGRHRRRYGDALRTRDRR